MTSAIQTAAQQLRDAQIVCKENEPMARHTTFLVGGPAALFIEPASAEQTALAVEICRLCGLSLFPLGRGSNLLVRDAGLSLAVLHLGENFSGIKALPGNRLEVLAGTKLTVLCKQSARLGLSGLEFGYGIPGNLGGCIYMNAGAYGGEMEQVVQSVTFLDEQGQLCTLSGSDLAFRYRHSVFSGRGCVILSAVLQFTPGDPEVIDAAMEDFMSRRREKQPLEYGSAGSTFKRPPGAFAAALIDQCGLKGYTVGGAQVSEKHAGFVINRGGATAADVLAVMAHVRNTVKAQTGFDLEPEVMLLPDVLPQPKGSGGCADWNET